MNILEEDFYHSGNQITEKYSILGNCISRNTFFIVRHKLIQLGVNDPERYLYKLYLQNWNIRISDGMDRVLECSVDENFNWKKIVDKTTEKIFENNPDDAIEYITKKLHNNQILLITANASDIVFHVSGHLDKNAKEQDDRKIRFLIIKENNENFYFVYTYSLCNKKKYTHYEKNESVGILSKNEFRNMFKKFVSIFTVDELQQVQVDEKECMQNVFSDILNDIVETNIGKKYVGIEAIKYIKTLTEQQKLILLNKENYNKKFEFYKVDCEKIRLSIVWSINRKKHFIQLAQELSIDNVEQIQYFNYLLKETISKWYLFSDVIKYKFYKSEDTLEDQMCIIKDVIQSEQKLNKYIETNFERLINLYTEEKK